MNIRNVYDGILMCREKLFPPLLQLPRIYASKTELEHVNNTVWELLKSSSNARSYFGSCRVSTPPSFHLYFFQESINLTFWSHKTCDILLHKHSLLLAPSLTWQWNKSGFDFFQRKTLWRVISFKVCSRILQNFV